MEVAQPFSILLEIPSGPVAVLYFRDLRSLRTSSQVQLRDDMAGEVLGGDGGGDGDRNGGNLRNQDQRKINQWQKTNLIGLP